MQSLMGRVSDSTPFASFQFEGCTVIDQAHRLRGAKLKPCLDQSPFNCSNSSPLEPFCAKATAQILVHSNVGGPDIRSLIVVQLKSISVIWSGMTLEDIELYSVRIQRKLDRIDLNGSHWGLSYIRLEYPRCMFLQRSSKTGLQMKKNPIFQ